MGTSSVWAAQPLPEKLNQWIDGILYGIKPPETQDYYRTQLQKEVWKVYKENSLSDRDEDQAVEHTIRSLGASEAILQRIHTDIQMKKARGATYAQRRNTVKAARSVPVPKLAESHTGGRGIRFSLSERFVAG